MSTPETVGTHPAATEMPNAGVPNVGPAASQSGNPSPADFHPDDSKAIGLEVPDDMIGKLERLQLAIKEKPYCMGVVNIPRSQGLLFYGNDDEARRLNFATATSGQLEHLYQTCQAAPFGLNGDSVLDPSYRKAGKLDLDEFLSAFDLAGSGILDIVKTELVEGEKRPVKAELYKLNVYGSGGFFKAHKDTPRSQDMFGSLVIVLPAVHEGGEFTLHHHGNTQTFASNMRSIDPNNLKVTYIAFYSDIEHEVASVKSGYRVTLTYNLRYTTVPDTTNSPSPFYVPNELQFQTALADLLADQAFLPHGGYLGFGLSHQYPLAVRTGEPAWLSYSGVNLNDLRKSFKGSDAVISRVCENLGLSADVYVVYEVNDDEEGTIASKYLHDLDGINDEMSIAQALIYAGAKWISRVDIDIEELDEDDIMRAVHWVTPLTEFNHLPGCIPIMYGNDRALDYFYGDICFIIRIDDAENRIC